MANILSIACLVMSAVSLILVYLAYAAAASNT
jgi:hypothetical protein